MMGKRLGVLLAMFLSMGVFQSAWGESYHLIVCGSGGGEPYVERFEEWGKRLRGVLVDTLGHANNRVRLLTERGTDADGVSTLGEIRKTFQWIGQGVRANDAVFVYLIGHGSYRQNVAKLNIPGEDLSADQVNEWMRRWPTQNITVINGASSSAAFVPVLSGKGRIVCTSTRNVDERNATQFMAFFIRALEEGTADQNRDERISVFEICQQAAILTEAWYKGEGYLATEHALIDDTGDGKGIRLTEIENFEGDGKIADSRFLMDMRVPPGTPQTLVDAYQSAIVSVQSLILKKSQLDSMSYYQQLTEKLLEAARLNQKIRQTPN